MNLDKEYWNQRYHEGQTGWDIGNASPALIGFASEFPKATSILIPGAGNAYEWIHLRESGYSACHAIDFAAEPIQRLQSVYPQWKTYLHQEDFFEHTGMYDLILEQTFFCALDPDKRISYVKKMADLLSQDGILAGLLFASPFEKAGPPFGAEAKTYLNLFKPMFELVKMESCANSIPARKGNELFFVAKKR